MACPLPNLIALSATQLHQHTQGVNGKRAGAEWELAFCLLAIERNQTYVELHCSTVVSYAERFLELAPHKSLELLRIARSLEHLPLLSQAYREGTLGSGKLRELIRVVTTENEQAWLTFAVTHNTREVERAVALPPKAYHQAQSTASAESATRNNGPAMSQTENGTPASSASGTSATATLWQANLSSVAGDAHPSEPTASTVVVHASEACSAMERSAVPPTAPAPPSLIRLTFVLTTDEYAHFESARRIVEARGGGKRLSRDRVLGALVRHIVNRLDTRGKLRGGLIVRTEMRDEDTPEQAASSAHYETDRGDLPVNDPAIQAVIADEIRRGRAAGSAGATEVASQQETPEEDTSLLESVETPVLRKPVPRGTERRVFERAQWRCEACRSRDALQLDHKIPRCHGGADQETNLQLLCRACHTLKHRDDFLQDVKFQTGYTAAIHKRAGKRPSPVLRTG